MSSPTCDAPDCKAEAVLLTINGRRCLARRCLEHRTDKQKREAELYMRSRRVEARR